MLFRFEDIAKILDGSRVYYLNGQPIRMDSDEEINRYRGYLVEKITNRDGHIVVEIRPWEAPKAEACSPEVWYQEHIKQFGRVPDFF
jgi:hypothetical protein